MDAHEKTGLREKDGDGTSAIDDRQRSRCTPAFKEMGLIQNRVTLLKVEWRHHSALIGTPCSVAAFFAGGLPRPELPYNAHY